MLNKKEIIWREILHRCFTPLEAGRPEAAVAVPLAGRPLTGFSDGVFVFTQQELAGKFSVSLSTVHNALKLPRASGAIVVTGRNFRVADKEKLLLLWASHRRLQKDVLYATTVPEGVFAIEGTMPPYAIYAAYSAYRKRYDVAPADYDVVYAYVDRASLSEMKRRFPPMKGTPNLFVLGADPHLATYGGTTPDVQTFVDLWNLPQWYAKDFLTAVRSKLHLD